MVPFERALVSSYMPPIVTFPPSFRVSEILPFLCFSRPLFPTPPLVSPKFSHVLLGVGGWTLGYEERRCWASCSCSLVSKISNLCGPDPLTSRTDRLIDGRTDDMRSQYRALHSSASRGKNGVLQHKRGIISETHTDRGKVTMGPTGTHQRSLQRHHPRPPMASPSLRFGFAPTQNSKRYYLLRNG